MQSLIDRILQGESGYLLDNVAITAGLGTTIATDTIAGADYQRIKLIHGADGVNAGDISTVNPLPTSFQLNPTDLSEVPINIAGNGDNSLVALSAAKIIRVWAFWLKVNGSGTGVSLKFRDNVTDLHPAIPFNDKDGWVMSFMGRPWFTCTVSQALQMNLSAAIQVSGRLYYTQV